jgi:hypothetical protein
MDFLRLRPGSALKKNNLSALSIAAARADRASLTSPAINARASRRLGGPLVGLGLEAEPLNAGVVELRVGVGDLLGRAGHGLSVCLYKYIKNIILFVCLFVELRVGVGDLLGRASVTGCLSVCLSVQPVQ